MTDYFDLLERELRGAVRRGAHRPWYARLVARRSRPLVALLACLVLGGSAYAAEQALRTGRAVGADAPALPYTFSGVPIASSVQLLALRVPDPVGGPPWGLEQYRTTRGLLCVELGRVFDGRLGVLGQDGVFSDDGRFHPLPVGFDEFGFNCGTEDAHGSAFTNAVEYGLPSSGLAYDRPITSGRCYATGRSCPAPELRTIAFGLLGPDAVSVTYGGTTEPTAGADGAYLAVLPFSRANCPLHRSPCAGGSTGGPQVSVGAITGVHYRGGAPDCTLPTETQLAALQARVWQRAAAQLRSRYPALAARVATFGGRRGMFAGRPALTAAEQAALIAAERPLEKALLIPPQCPTVGYVAPGGPTVTAAQVAAPVHVRVVRASRYCSGVSSSLVPCDRRVPRGLQVLPMHGQPPQVLLVVSFRARVAVSNNDRWYEIGTSNPPSRGHARCAGQGTGSFGPVDTNLRAGQLVRYTTLMDADCPGRAGVTVQFIRTNGPAGSMPVPGLSGEAAPLTVGQTTALIP
ncbi:MAG TPA: hypothetical protein VHX88_20830 [Solirubrobacteraceae bacterium]|jgi:hypothetical protein|nr:hypothetical protein [Solirubrobacteraceae bacterium]